MIEIYIDASASKDKASMGGGVYIEHVSTYNNLKLSVMNNRDKCDYSSDKAELEMVLFTLDLIIAMHMKYKHSESKWFDLLCEKFIILEDLYSVLIKINPDIMKNLSSFNEYCILSDSQYVIETIKYCKMEDIEKNKQQFQSVFGRLKAIAYLDVNVNFGWVKGHYNNVGNNYADTLAKKALRKRYLF